MQVVIDIPEEKYLDAKHLVEKGKEDNPVVIAIGNGTPLPKGHGRLIDADAFLDTLSCGDRYYVEDIYVKGCIENDAPTIIEAEK